MSPNIVRRGDSLKRCALVPLLFAGLLATHLSAQSDPLKLPAFDVASVRPSPPQIGDVTSSVPGRFLPAGYESRNALLLTIIRRAYPDYSLEQGQIVAPAWVSVERFDVDARAGTDAPIGQIRLMLRRLLAERFNLRVHTEMRELDAYELVVARRDGRLGPQIRPSKTNCSAVDAAVARGEPPPQPATPGGPLPCGASQALGTVNRLHLGGRSMFSLVIGLQYALGRRVADRTGLTGNYDLELTWASDSALLAGDDAKAPSLLTAVQDQLGLRLQPAKVKLEVLVIDRIERPTPN